MRRRGWAQQLLFDALTQAGDAGLTVQELAVLLYHEATPHTTDQVRKLIERSRHYSSRPMSIEYRGAYRLQRDHSPAPPLDAGPYQGNSGGSEGYDGGARLGGGLPLIGYRRCTCGEWDVDHHWMFGTCLRPECACARMEYHS